MEEEYWLLKILNPRIASVAFLFIFHWQELVRWPQLSTRKVGRDGLARNKGEVKVGVMISWHPLPTDVR